MTRSFCFLVGVLALAALPAATGDDTTSAPTVRKPRKAIVRTITPDAAARPERPALGLSAQEVYIDPRTGRFTDPPRGARAAGLSPGLAPQAAASEEKVEETESPVPGGGILVLLPARFMNPLVATVGEGGELILRHAPEPTKPKGKE